MQSGLTEDLTGKGLKFKGDDSKEIAKKLNNTMEIIGGADSKTLTEGNIGVNSTDKGQLKVQLAKDLKGITSISNQTTTKDSAGKDVPTGARITLSGSDGTVNVNGGKVTGLAAGTGDTDAVTVKQMNDKIDTKISDVTYTAGNGINLSNKQISAKAGTGITVDADGINVNLGEHLATDTNTGAIDVQDTGAVVENNADLVTGGTVYNALHGGLTDITVGKDGQNGQAGSIGLVGPKGQDGLTTTIIKTEKGADGVDGKNGQDGITRIVYNDTTDPNKKQTVATLDDGLKFKGDDGTEIAKKLNSTLDIIGGADSTKLTDNNIGVNKTEKGELKIQLAKDLTGLNSATYTTKSGPEGAQTESTTTVNGNGLTITGGPSITKDGINGGGQVVTNIGSALNGNKYSDDKKSSAANLGDVNSMITDAVQSASDTTNQALDQKANVDASNIGENIKDAKGNKVSDTVNCQAKCNTFEK